MNGQKWKGFRCLIVFFPHVAEIYFAFFSFRQFISFKLSFGRFKRNENKKDFNKKAVKKKTKGQKTVMHLEWLNNCGVTLHPIRSIYGTGPHRLSSIRFCYCYCFTCTCSFSIIWYSKHTQSRRCWSFLWSCFCLNCESKYNCFMFDNQTWRYTYMFNTYLSNVCTHAHGILRLCFSLLVLLLCFIH